MNKKNEKINPNQFFDFIIREELGWQTIIYDLIRTEQLDPWDIDIGILADKYIEKIQQLEEADFFISSKVLLACSLLLRLKSEILANNYIQDLNNELYGNREEKRYEIERIEIDEGDLPLIIPITPMTRHKKVTLKELMKALNQAIETENRRIKREIKEKQTEKSVLTILPKDYTPLKTQIKNIFNFIKSHNEKGNGHIKFSTLAPSKEEKLTSFVPILYLSNDNRIYLRQQNPFDDIHIYFEKIKEETEEIERELELLDKEEIVESEENFEEELEDLNREI